MTHLRRTKGSTDEWRGKQFSRRKARLHPGARGWGGGRKRERLPGDLRRHLSSLKWGITGRLGVSHRENPYSSTIERARRMVNLSGR